MRPEYLASIREAFLSVMERYAFMFGEEMPKGEFPLSGREFIKAGCSFTGPLVGSMILAVPQDMSAHIASGILGKDPDEYAIHHMGPDALKELVNVACGYVLRRIAGNDGPMELTIPSLSSLSPSEIPSYLNDEGTIPFRMEGYPMFVWMWVKVPR